MKKMFVFAATALLALSACKKEDVRSSQVEGTLSKSQVVASGPNAVNGSEKWIDVKETFPVQFSAWNMCTGEMVDFSGTGHLSIQGSVNNNGYNFKMHYNAMGIQGVGQTSGIIYRTTDSFNYHNKGSFENGQVVYNQTGTIRYTSAGNEPDLVSEDGWHLTVNANGEVTSFYTTAGRIYSCR
jgi:hypothetical protein